MGSSPRMRGTPLVVWGDSCDEGIIPAYAGNTPRAAWTPRSCRDHPRVCGEHSESGMDTKIVQGSSPRMRGTRFKCARQSSTTGIIPAYAGNTGTTRPCQQPSWGSSPRMRGTRMRRGIRCCGGGIIPAYAGNTSGSTFLNTLSRDHPRVCGEHLRDMRGEY